MSLKSFRKLPRLSDFPHEETNPAVLLLLEIRHRRREEILARSETRSGEAIVGQRPSEVGGATSARACASIIYQYHPAPTTQPLIPEPPRAWEVQHSTGQRSALISERKDAFSRGEADVAGQRPGLGCLPDLAIKRDDTGPFNEPLPALYWVPAELANRMMPKR